MNMHHLNCVEIITPAGDKVIGHCLLLEYQNNLVLVDVGIGLQDTYDPAGRLGLELISMVGFQFNELHTAYRQIEQLGFQPSAVKHCILTHLDPDHIGGLADFPGMELHVAQEEFNNFNSGNPRYLPHQLGHRSVVHTYGPSKQKWCGLEVRRVDVGFPADIFLVPLPGHTMGHCGVAIKKAEDWVLHVGDAYYYRVETETDQHPVSQLTALRADNNELRIESLDKIKQLMRQYPDVEVFSTHDPAEFPVS